MMIVKKIDSILISEIQLVVRPRRKSYEKAYNCFFSNFHFNKYYIL